MARYGMVIDLNRCTACYCCFAACKDEYWGNDYPPYTAAQPKYGQFWMNISKNERGKHPYVKVAYMPVPCMQCENPPCLKNAQKEAIYQRADGIVVIDPLKAKGQKQLINGKSCPYGAIYWNEEKELPQKCTFCLHRLEAGKQPRCVQVCPSECIRFGDLNDPQSEISKLIRSSGAEAWHTEWDTKPRVFYIGLDKMTRHFLAGAVVLGDIDECAEGATITVKDFQGVIKITKTNAFGNFEVDGLKSGKYLLNIEIPGYQTQTLNIELKISQYLGEIKLAKT
jgi:Fe-S-cluster-containing dehydrogenase component